MLTGQSSILVVQRTSPSVVSIHTRRSSLTYKTNIRRCFSPPMRFTSWTSLRCPWSSVGTNGRCGTEPTISARTIRRAAHKRRVLLLIKYLDGRDMQSRSIWLQGFRPMAGRPRCVAVLSTVLQLSTRLQSTDPPFECVFYNPLRPRTSAQAMERFYAPAANG